MKKGFTLVEVLAVLAVLALVAGISYPIVTGIIKEMNNSVDESQGRLVIDAAKYWVKDNSYMLSDEVGDIYTLDVKTLIRLEYLSNMDANIADTACVKITTEAHKYSYEYKEKCQ